MKNAAQLKQIKAAVIQINSGDDKEKNFARAESLIHEASSRGATVIALPETFSWRGSRKYIFKNAEPIPGPTTEKLSRLASSCNIYLLAGSIVEKSPLRQKAFNTSILFDTTGTIIARYRKIHLFQLQINNHTVIREDACFLPGNTRVCVPLPFCKAGLSICYDLRFPDLYRALAQKGATLFFVPSAFTFETGRLHWEVLLRARAIENQAYILAPNQYGYNPLGYKDYGHSMIINPLGEVMCRASDHEDVLIAELNFDFLKTVRKNLPVLEHVRKTRHTKR